MGVLIGPLIRHEGNKYQAAAAADRDPPAADIYPGEFRPPTVFSSMKKHHPRKVAITTAVITAITLPCLFGVGATAAYATTPVTMGDPSDLVQPVMPDADSVTDAYTLAPLSTFQQFGSDNHAVWKDWQQEQVKIAKKVAARVAARAELREVAGDRAKLIADARKYEDVVPYVFGGETPAGWDCSGFTKYVYAETLGIEMGHGVNMQSVLGKTVIKDQAQPGDMVLFSNAAETNFHIGIYLGNDMMIHAPYPGAKTRLGNINFGDNTLQFVNVIDPAAGHKIGDPYYSYDVASTDDKIAY